MATSAEILATARERARANAIPYEGLLLPSEAAQLMREDTSAVLVDVRSRAEWDFVGRIPGAVEIEWKSYPGMLPNAQFQEQLASRVKKDALVMFICVLAGIGTAGVPAGSLPVIAMILGMFGIPPEGLGLIIGVDRLLDMCRTTLNVTGDLVAAEQMAAARQAGDAGSLAFASAAFTGWNTEMQGMRQRAVDIIKDVSGDRGYNDVNFVFPTWVTTQLPIGVVGMVIAAIFAAAMSAVSAELAALSTASVIDFYRRWIRPQAEDRHYLVVSRFATAFWGVFASVVAIFSVELGSLIEVVNRFGSFFYGSILGVFALAVFVRRAGGTGAFVGLLAGMSAVAAVTFGRPDISFLWHNVVGAVVVYLVGLAWSAIAPATPAQRAV